ncbi:MAG: Clp protease N-terminal domain-containing protein [Acidimicrobiales bacterium]|jgi:hypothetical protein
MIRHLAQHRVSRTRDQRYGPEYSFGATYYDARDEALRRGDRVIGTEHLLLALLVDPASPAAKAIGRDLETARRVLADLDAEALSAIGIEPGIAAGPPRVRTQTRLRLTPGAKAIFTSIPDARRSRKPGLEKVFNSLLDLRAPDPAATLLSRLGVDRRASRTRFTELEEEAGP